MLLIAFGIKNGQKLVLRQSPQITVTDEVIDYANHDETFNLTDSEVTFIIESRVQSETGTTYDIPEKFGRIVAFRVEIPSTEKIRSAFLKENYVPDEDKVLPFVPCLGDEILGRVHDSLHL